MKILTRGWVEARWFLAEERRMPVNINLKVDKLQLSWMHVMHDHDQKISLELWFRENLKYIRSKIENEKIYNLQQLLPIGE